MTRSWWRFLRLHGVPPLRTCDTVSAFIHNDEFSASGMRFGATLEEYYAEYAAVIAANDPSRHKHTVAVRASHMNIVLLHSENPQK